ncbi:MAG: DNA-directed RNA polymerase subunit alpha C-terminal domain-containing protein [Phycisphaerales bacterium]
MSSKLDMVIGGGSGESAVRDPNAAREAFVAARTAEDEGDRYIAIEQYRRAARLDDGNPEYAFRLAYQLDLVGEEDEALSIYEHLVDGPRPYVNALINISVIYEDRGDIQKAEKCLRQVLDTDPNHPRARLYFKDVEASKDMYYDEEQARDQARQNALLDTPVTDFELSVRARNCLRKMQIRTLGDLLKITEAELLSYKNFGETSLVEIKQMLHSKGLRLGQGSEGQYGRVRKEIYEGLKGKASEAVLNKPISVLDLSVRARKALNILGVQTIGDLATRTEAELMGVKNFGQTSLDEIRRKLQDHNLDLRKLE